MAIEIEHKFLVDQSKLPALPQGRAIRQGYICNQDNATVRIRIYADQGYITIKSPTVGLSRQEYEYPIPRADAEELLANHCQTPLIEKHRYEITYEGHVWELDVFAGDNQGLMVAEIELQEESETFVRPPWVTEDVSHDPRFRNSNLIKNPYCNWRDSI